MPGNTSFDGKRDLVVLRQGSNASWTSSQAVERGARRLVPVCDSRYEAMLPAGRESERRTLCLRLDNRLKHIVFQPIPGSSAIGGAVSAIFVMGGGLAHLLTVAWPDASPLECGWSCVWGADKPLRTQMMTVSTLLWRFFKRVLALFEKGLRVETEGSEALQQTLVARSCVFRLSDSLRMPTRRARF